MGRKSRGICAGRTRQRSILRRSYSERLEENKQYNFLREIVEPVSDGVSQLSQKEQRTVELAYFRGMPLSIVAKQQGYNSITYVQAMRDRALYALKKHVCIFTKMYIVSGKKIL